MATFMAFCEDHPDSDGLRAQHLTAHLAYVETVMERIRVAGPLREDDDAAVGGSCFVYRADSLEDAQALLQDDPYHRAGIYASVRWFRLNPAAGQWVGGRNW